MNQTITVQLVPMEFGASQVQADLVIFAAFLAALAAVWGLKWIANYLMQGGSDV